MGSGRGRRILVPSCRHHACVAWGRRRAHDAGRAQGVDLVAAVAQLPQQRHAVLAQRRRRLPQRQALAVDGQRSSAMRVSKAWPAPLASAGTVTAARPPVARRCGSSNRSCGRVIGA